MQEQRNQDREVRQNDEQRSSGMPLTFNPFSYSGINVAVVPQRCQPLQARIAAIARQPYTEPPARHDCGHMNIECSHCKGLHWIDEKIAKSSVINPSFGICCNHGQITLPLLPLPPPALAPLYINSDARSKNFKEHIWAYNRAFAFTSLGVNVGTTLTLTLRWARSQEAQQTSTKRNQEWG